MPKKVTKKASSRDKNGSNFEDSLKELEQLVERMEQGELSLEQALTDFQRGIELSRNCQEALQSAEQQVQILLQQGEEGQLAPFDEKE